MVYFFFSKEGTDLFTLPTSFTLFFARAARKRENPALFEPQSARNREPVSASTLSSTFKSPGRPGPRLPDCLLPALDRAFLTTRCRRAGTPRGPLGPLGRGSAAPFPVRHRAPRPITTLQNDAEFYVQVVSADLHFLRQLNPSKVRPARTCLGEIMTRVSSLVLEFAPHGRRHKSSGSIRTRKRRLPRKCRHDSPKQKE